MITARQSFENLAALVGLSASDVHIDEAEPVYPIVPRSVTAGSAALAAVGVAAADLWALRTGRRQHVSISARAVAPALRSVRLMTIDGVSAREHGGHPTRGFYRTKDDRWIYLHCNFENLRERNLRPLGGVTERADAEREILKWNGLDLEEAIFAEGGACSFVRSEEEWLATEQASAVETLPLLEIVKIGEAPPEPLPACDMPLSGLRALDLTRVLAGPTSAKMLAEFGADVMKISRPGLPHGGLPDFDAEIGKLSAYIDMRKPNEIAALQQLITQSDVFIQAYRPGTLAGRGFSPEAVAALRPGIIYVTLSAWGHQGPWRDRRGFDTVVQGANGTAFTADNSRPEVLPVAQMDYIAGYLMALGAMIALRKRAEEGGSWFVRTSLAGVGRWIAGHGKNSPDAIRSLPPELSPEELRPLLMESRSAMGMLRHLRPVIGMSETPGYLVREGVPLGYHQPVWPASLADPGLPADC